MTNFAPISSDYPYWRKQTSPLFSDLIWNIPEQKTGEISLIGGNRQNFSAVVRIAEFLSQTFPLRDVNILLPDALRGQLPPLANVNFATSTESGSFAKSFDLNHTISDSQFSILIGDFSKNSATAIALTDAIVASLTDPHPLLLTRDTIDLLAPTFTQIIPHPHLFLVASMVQLQKIFRALYYPKMLLLSQPLVSVVETLHKFTLTYLPTLLTFHQDHIIVAHAGNIVTTHLVDTSYSPISLWSGQLAGKTAALNLYNPSHPLEATSAAILFN